MKKHKKGFVFFLIAILCFAMGFGLWGYNLLENKQAQKSAQAALTQLKETLQPTTLLPGEIPDYQLDTTREMPIKTIDGIDYIGILSIPSKNLELPIISNWSYPNLKISPCRYNGTVYADDFIIAAHNFRSHFGSLKELSLGDAVVFTDVEGNEFSYRVVDLETLQPTAIEDMKTGDWDLTLFTCTLGGASRVTVRCEKIK